MHVPKPSRPEEPFLPLLDDPPRPSPARRRRGVPGRAAGIPRSCGVASDDPAPGASILVVDADEAMRRSVVSVARRLGHSTRDAATAAAAEEALATRSFDVVATGLRLRGGSGFEVLAAAARLQPDAPVLLFARNPSATFVQDAQRLGAFACIVAPADLEEVEERLRQAAEIASLRREVRRARSLRRPGPGAEALLGVSHAARALRARVRSLAASGRPVLLEGETGSGMRAVARALHAESGRRGGAFVEVPCDATRSVESDLLGEGGAGADEDETASPGLLEAAHGGTLFVDRIERLSPPDQARLLAVVRTGRIASRGGRETRVDVRLVASTRDDLVHLASTSGSSRVLPDLLAALRGTVLRVAPLRERAEDVPLLARHFATKVAPAWGRAGISISDEVCAALASRPWPGNVRELRIAVERAVVGATSDVLQPADFRGAGAPHGGSASVDGLLDGGLRLEELEDALVRGAVVRTRWNLAAAARALGLTRDQVRYRVKRLGLHRGEGATEAP